MEQLHTLKTAIPNVNEICGKCSDIFTSAAVKCDLCSKYVHLKCSRMPVHMAIKYFISRIQYVCETCMETKTDNYETLCDWADSLGVHGDGESRVSEVHTGESSNDSTTTEVMKRNNDQITGITTALAELKEQVSMLTAKINVNSENGPNLTFNDSRKGTAVRTNKTKPTNKSRQDNLPSILYADAAAKVNPNQHVVFIKPKDLMTPPNNEEIISALKNVPTVAVKTTQQKTMKLVFPTESTKDRAVEALEANNQIAGKHQIISEKKLKPKICITFIPDYIEDSVIIQSIQDKNEPLADQMVEADDMKLLFTKPSTPGYKTAVITVSPSIRKEIENNDNRIYLHLSRCKVYDHYWVRRCGRCMGYGHKTVNCHATEPVCGHCAQTHLSNSCTNKHQLKCHHCTTSEREETNHSAFNTQCPTFIQAKHNIIRRTERIPKNLVPKN